MKKVFLDFGHGGKDPGAIGNGLQEKDIVLSVGLLVGKVLERHNVEVYYSRTTDIFIELTERSTMANRLDVDVFVSIHCNSFGDGKAQGLETFSHPLSKNGTALAKCIQDSILKDKLHTKDRGIKTANFSVLRNTKATAALVELGFISNKEDSEILKNKQSELAESVAKGILNFLGVKYMKEEKSTDLIKLNLHGRDIEVEGIFLDKTNYVPIRFIEDLGYKVTWKDGKVNINYRKD